MYACRILNMKKYKMTTKVTACFLLLLALFLYIFADRLSQEGTDEDVVLKNDCFFLLRDQGEKYVTYKIRFKDSVSAVDVISSIKQIVDFCADEEKNNLYCIYFAAPENLNHLFFEYYNKDEERLSPAIIDNIDNEEISNMYAIFLRKHLIDNGCTLADSAYIITPDLDCFTDFDKKIYLITEICIRFNWEIISNAATLE